MNHRFLLCSALFCAPLLPCLADTVKLKSGEVIEGTILETTPTEIVIEVQFSPTIKDQQRINRADIEGIGRATPDEAAFLEIQETAVIPGTALDSKAHETILAGKLRPFMDRFSYSPRAADVKKMIADIESEIARFQNGDVKVSGVWYDRETFAKEKYQVDADGQLAAMKQAMVASDFVGAVNAFEDLQRTYPNSAAYAESVALAKEATEKLRQQLRFALANLQQTLTERRQTIERTPASQRTAIERALQDEEARVAAMAAAAQKANQRFYRVVAFDEKGLKAMDGHLRTLEQQIASLDARALARQAALARRASHEISDGQIAAAAASVASLRAEWPQFEALTRLEQRVREAEASAATLEP